MGTTVCVFGLSDLSSPADLVRFLESFTGVQAIAQCKFQAGKKDGGRPWALVQFKSSDDAFSVIELARRGKLTFLGGRLTIFADKKQHQRKRDDSEVTITDVVVQAGCLVRNDLFYSLWQRPGCDIIAGLKKFCIIVHGNRNDYDTCKDLCKLEWRSSDIVEFSSWKEISGRLTFMLRAWNAPQIFRYSPSPDYYACEGFFGYLLSGLSDGVWVRTVDFSPEASIGQSYVYCLHVNQQFSGELDFLINTNPGFPVIQRNLSIRLGCHYSASLQTVPILASPYLQYIPFEIVFSVNSLVQTGYLSGPGLGHRFFGLLSPTLEKTKDHILHVLEKFKRLEDTCFEPEQWFEKESSEALRQPERRRLIERHLDDGLQYIRKVLVTPTRVYFRGPEVDFSNRVTRHFKEHIDNFIRVSFVEEDADVIPASVFVMHKAFGLQSENADMYNRIVSVLSDGITIGNKVFEFLAFSSSQLRDNSVWMFSATDTVTADGIRNWMGDFLGIRNVAKCAARMGQSFSSSTKSLDVPLSEIEEIPDISTESLTGRYCFSDGIGKISASFATKVAKQCKLKVVPSLYQIRYGGFKGVVAVHPTSIYKLSLRPSMKKFPSQQISLDILKHSQIVPSYLNREIITLLSTLGVKDTIFERMQEKVVEQLDTMLTDAVVALEVVQSFNRSVTNQIMEEMLLGGFHPISEPFLRRMLYTFRASQLMDLRKKARIFVPKGRLLMGCLDETRTLDYGEVFVCVSPIAETHSVVEDGLSYSRVKGINNIHRIAGVVKGKVIVAKNPCVHPGDIRVLTAVNVPALHHLIDCVVFPQKGCRPHPNECSGSDLDGDEYFVSWDPKLIPPEVNEPQNYEPAPEQRLDRPVNTQDIIRYFADFMQNNTLGLISNAHVVFADSSYFMARDPKCLELAKLCSIAVDFPKTGVPAKLPAELRPTTYPDFMEKTDKDSYVSTKVLGKLYRAVVRADKDQLISSFTRQEAIKYYDEQLEFYGFKDYLDEAEALRNCYNEKLLELMYQYDVKSESEIVTGYILSLSKWFRRRSGETKQRIMIAMGSLRKEARRWLKNEGDDVDEDDCSAVTHQELEKASAWYHVTYHPDYVSDPLPKKYGHLLSFPWVVYDKLVLIKKSSCR